VPKAFPSEVDTGSRQENALEQRARAVPDPAGSETALADSRLFALARLARLRIVDNMENEYPRE
jgi:hypothetical protein